MQPAGAIALHFGHMLIKLGFICLHEIEGALLNDEVNQCSIRCIPNKFTHTREREEKKTWVFSRTKERKAGSGSGSDSGGGDGVVSTNKVNNLGLFP